MIAPNQLKSSGWIIAVAICLVGCGEESETPSMNESVPAISEAATQPGASLDISDAPAEAVAINEVCPVAGESIDPYGKKVAYKGDVYGFCCNECIGPFRAAPDKYVKSH